MREYLAASGLIAFLNGVGTESEFKNLIVRLAEEAVEAKKERGRVAPIYFIDDAGKFTVEPRHVQRLCDAFLAGSLAQEEIIYLTTAIELSSDFTYSSPPVERAIFDFADETSDVPWSTQFVSAVRESV